MEYMKSDYQPNLWGYHGGEILKLILKEQCGVEHDDFNILPIDKLCGDLQLLPYFYFLPFDPYKFDAVFQPATKATASWFNSSWSIHIWNTRTKHEFIDIESNQLYALMAKDHCPKLLQ